MMTARVVTDGFGRSRASSRRPGLEGVNASQDRRARPGLVCLRR